MLKEKYSKEVLMIKLRILVSLPFSFVSYYFVTENKTPAEMQTLGLRAGGTKLQD